MSVSPLSADFLRRLCDPSIFNFQDTSSLTPSIGLINQERAVRAVKFAMSIHQEGFNIYMAGRPGLGKTRYAMEIAHKYANSMPVPDDWCYVYNFENPMHPKTINLPAGKGKEFKKDMEIFVKNIQQEIKKAFEGEEYEIERSKILEEFRVQKEQYSIDLSNAAQERGFKVKITSSGIYFIPIINGSPISEEDYNLLDEEIKIELSNSSEELQRETQDIIRKIRQIEMQAESAIREWEKQIAHYTVSLYIDDLNKKYKEFPKSLAILTVSKRYT